MSAAFQALRGLDAEFAASGKGPDHRWRLTLADAIAESEEMEHLANSGSGIADKPPRSAGGGQAASMQSQFLDRADAANSNTEAALAIIDCVRVLCALERAPDMVDAELSTGHGYALGNITRDSSMSTSLYHAMGLVEKVNDAAQNMSRLIEGAV